MATFIQFSSTAWHFTSFIHTVWIMSKFIRSFKVVPQELFRINNGSIVSLRDRSVKKKGKFDVDSKGGTLVPKGLDSESYEGFFRRVFFNDLNVTKNSTKRGINAPLQCGHVWTCSRMARKPNRGFQYFSRFAFYEMPYSCIDQIT